MKTQWKRSLAYLAALCGTLGMAWGAHADWFYDFQSAPPTSFVTGSGVAGSGPPSATFLSSAGDGVLQFSDTLSPADGGAFGAFGIETSQVFTDVRLTGTLNPAGTTDNILNLTRGDLAGNVYTAGFAFADGPNGERAANLQIAKIVGGGPVKIVLSTDASQGSQPPLTDLARGYFLQFDIVGNQLTARLFDVEGGTQLLVVNYTDSGDGGPPLASGMAGVFALATGGLLGATFGPVGATAIPGWFYDFQTAPPPSFVMGSIPPSGTFSSSVGGGVLHLSDTTLPADGGAAVGFGVETSLAFTDVRVTATLNPTRSTDNILFLRVRDDPQAVSHYATGMDFVTGVVRIAKISGGAPVEVVFSTDDSQGNQPPLTDLAGSYFLHLEMVGHSLTATVFDVEGGTQLLVVTYTDTGVGGPPFESGLVGMSSLSNRGQTTLLDGNFGPVRATAILP
jgi:hypothetical protein